MARPGLNGHRKMRRLVHVLGRPRYQCRGLLETMWEAAYEAGEPRLGDALDVALAAEWDGERHEELAEALLAAGFIDRDEAGQYWIHDLYDNAPEYVMLRRIRALERMSEVPARTLRQLVASGELDLVRPPPRAELRRMGGLSTNGHAVEQRGTTCDNVEQRGTEFDNVPQRDHSPPNSPDSESPPIAPPVAGGGGERGRRGPGSRSRRRRGDALGPSTPPSDDLPPANVAAALLERHLEERRDRAPPAAIRRLVASSGVEWPDVETPETLEQLVGRLYEVAGFGGRSPPAAARA